MTTRVAGRKWLASLLAVGLGCGLVASLVHADEAKGISWTHGLSFQVRKAGEKDFNDKTQKFGAEVFQDKALNKLVYITEGTQIGLGAAGKVPGADVKAPKLFHALEVRVRKGDEKEFSDKTQKFSCEVFHDVNTDNLVYISEKGSIGVMPLGSLSTPDKIKDPTWFHGLDLKVRKAGEKDFSDKTKKIGLEVYKDENTNQLLYVTDVGAIAIVPSAGAEKPKEVKGPTWYHAFEVKARKAKDEKFDKKTRMYGVEVYKDENADTLIYVCESGSIAVVPAKSLSKPESSKEPDWKFGRSFRVRKASETDFNDKTLQIGAEIYEDKNTGNSVYITEEGNIVVLPK